MILTQNNPYMLAATTCILNPDIPAPAIPIFEYSEEQVRDQIQAKYRDVDGDGYLDISPDEKLSDNFKYKELIFSDNANKYGLENRVPAKDADIILNAKFTAKTILEPCRDQFGSFTPNSWYRGPEVEYAATFEQGFRQYILKSYKRTLNSEPTAEELVSVMLSIRLHRDLVRNAVNSKSGSYALILKLWDQYYSGKQHPRGEAVDFEITKSGSNRKLFDWIKSSKIPYDQLILEFHKPAVGAFTGWVHGSTTETERTGKKNRRSAFEI